MITIPKFLCKHLGLINKTNLFIYAKDGILIISKKNQNLGDLGQEYDLELRYKLRRVGTSTSLALTMVKPIQTLMNYQENQRVDVQLIGDCITVHKLEDGVSGTEEVNPSTESV